MATFELKIDDTAHRLTICLPFNGLLPHLIAAAAPEVLTERERAQRALASDRLHQRIQSVPVDVAVQLRSTLVEADRLRDLQPGDVLRLSHPAAAPLDVTLDNTIFAHATPGTHGRKLAALIVATPNKEPR